MEIKQSDVKFQNAIREHPEIFMPLQCANRDFPLLMRALVILFDFNKEEEESIVEYLANLDALHFGTADHPDGSALNLVCGHGSYEGTRNEVPIRVITHIFNTNRKVAVAYRRRIVKNFTPAEWLRSLLIEDADVAKSLSKKWNEH